MKVIYALLLANILHSVRNEREALWLKTFSPYYLPPGETFTDPKLTNIVNHKYFCPIEETKHLSTKHLENCLIEKEFSDESSKSCPKPVQPGIYPQTDREKGAISCGANDSVRSYGVVFQFCTTNELLSKVFQKMNVKNELKTFLYQEPDHYTDVYLANVFSFCYNHDEEQTAYTYHKIWVPEGAPENPDEISSYEPSDMIMNDYNIFKHIQKITEFYEIYDDFGVQPQTLIPVHDLIPYETEQVRRHAINFRPQWKGVIALWNTINKHIRKIAYQLKEKKEELTVFTGTFEMVHVNASQPAKTNIPKYWCKIVANQKQNQAIAIVLHNKIYVEEERICQPSGCDISKWAEIDAKVAQNAYCCSFSNETIKKWFDWIPDMRVLGVLELN